MIIDAIKYIQLYQELNDFMGNILNKMSHTGFACEYENPGLNSVLILSFNVMHIIFHLMLLVDLKSITLMSSSS